ASAIFLMCAPLWRSAARPAASISTPARSSMTSSASRSESSSSTSMRNGRRTCSATKAPTPCRTTTRPSARRHATASRTTVRLTPVAAIISFSVGSFEPGGRRPPVMSAPMRATNCSVSPRGATSGRNVGSGCATERACNVPPITETRGRRNMDRRAFIRLGAGLSARLGAGTAVAGLAGNLGTPALAQQKLALKASDVHPAGYPTVAAVESLGKKLEAATQGRLSVQMFASMQLGGEKEAIEQAQVGAIQLARVSVGTLGPVIDELNVFNLPFLFRNTAHMQKVIDGDIGTELLDKVSNNDKAGLIGLCWMDAGARSVYTIKKPVHTIADLTGLKIRVIGNPMFVDMMNALGGNGVAMGYDQVFSALQTGVVDGAENNPPSYVFDNHYTVAKYYTLTQHLIVPEILVFSRKTWDAL